MLNRKLPAALAFGSLALMGALSVTSAYAASLPDGSVLTINPGVPVYNTDGDQINTSGSWFAMDADGNVSISGSEKLALQQGTTGIVIGVPTLPGASHSGYPTVGDTNAITAPWSFLGNTGSEYTTSPIRPIGGDTGNGLDFSGWTVTWNGVTVIPMGTGAWGAGFSNGVANMAWDGVYGNAYTLDYHATVPVNDPSGFGGVRYALHLEGVVSVPETSTYGMMLAGLGLVAMAVRRRRAVFTAGCSKYTTTYYNNTEDT